MAGYWPSSLFCVYGRRHNSAPKLPLIGEFFFAELLKMFLHCSSSDSYDSVSRDTAPFPVEQIPCFIIAFS